MNGAKNGETARRTASEKKAEKWTRLCPLSERLGQARKSLKRTKPNLNVYGLVEPSVNIPRFLCLFHRHTCRGPCVVYYGFTTGLELGVHESLRRCTRQRGHVSVAFK